MTIQPNPSPALAYAPSQRIDAHVHLWHFDEEDYPWLDARMEAIRRDVTVDEMVDTMDAAEIAGGVVVQARESLEETRQLLNFAGQSEKIRGVVGWVSLAADELPSIMDEFSDASRLVGIRENLQGKPSALIDSPEFNRGIALLTERDLSYDILIFDSQLEDILPLIDRHPQQRFILDHAAKPPIARGELYPWKPRIEELARRPNVVCKLSGLVTEADWYSWTEDSLRPYLDTCVEAFGTERLLAGSDWPVCLLATTYQGWWGVLEKYFANFSGQELQAVCGSNAVAWYGLRGVGSDEILA